MYASLSTTLKLCFWYFNNIVLRCSRKISYGISIDFQTKMNYYSFYIIIAWVNLAIIVNEISRLTNLRFPTLYFWIGLIIGVPCTAYILALIIRSIPLIKDIKLERYKSVKIVVLSSIFMYVGFLALYIKYRVHW